MNQALYNSTLKVLTQRGCPTAMAKKAAKVVAKDDATKPNLGRSSLDQQAINAVMKYLQ